MVFLLTVWHWGSSAFPGQTPGCHPGAEESADHRWKSIALPKGARRHIMVVGREAKGKSLGSHDCDTPYFGVPSLLCSVKVVLHLLYNLVRLCCRTCDFENETNAVSEWIIVVVRTIIAFTGPVWVFSQSIVDDQQA